MSSEQFNFISKLMALGNVQPKGNKVENKSKYTSEYCLVLIHVVLLRTYPCCTA